MHKISNQADNLENNPSHQPQFGSQSLGLNTKEANDAISHETLLHDTAHVLAAALKNIYGNKIQITIGPSIKNGFYYDIDANFSITPDDFEAIEKEMLKIAHKNHEFIKEEWSKEKALEYFRSLGEHYKAELIEGIQDKIFVYKNGDFIDLCKGPHLESTKYVRHFKLLKVAGSYWRGDSKNKMLQRIYGTSFFTKEDLDAYLFQIQEAEKRDHRKLGRELDLFHLQEEAQGMPFWHPKGWTINLILEDYIRKVMLEDGYQEVRTPMVYDKILWEKSGHWEKFGDDIFSFNKNDREMAIKPMNCPAHVQIFNQSIKSYRDLPLRMSEFGVCHRDEPSGALFGLMRVRSFRQDDGHIFCTIEQIFAEIQKFVRTLFLVYKKFGFDNVIIKFSDRPKVRAGEDQVWDLAEAALTDALDAMNLEYAINKGEGAFYGPKLEFTLVDALGREWQCGTIQVDMVLPARLGAYYITPEGTKQECVMIHRAILGSFERFIGILIEHHAGKMPIWLSPIQIMIIKISDNDPKLDEYSQEVLALLDSQFRVEIYKGGERIQKKIAGCLSAKIPIMLILGKGEAEKRQATLRMRDAPDQHILDFSEIISFINQLEQENK